MKIVSYRDKDLKIIAVFSMFQMIASAFYVKNVISTAPMDPQMGLMLQL